MRRTSVTSLSVFAVVLGSVGTAHAQSATGFAVDKFEPSERGSDWFTTESLDLRGSGRPALGVITDYQLRPLATYKSNGDANRSIVFAVANVRLDRGGAVVGGSGGIEATYNFRGNQTAAASMVAVTVKNQVASYA